MCNKAVFKSALIVVLWVASVSSVSYFYEKPKKTHDITRHGKSSSYFHFNQEVPEKVPKHPYYKQSVVRPDESEANFPYPTRDHLIEKPEYITPTEPTNYGNYEQENLHKDYSYDDKPESNFYKEANKYYSSLFKLPEDTYKNSFTTYMEQSTPSYYSHVKLTRPKSTLRKIPSKSLDHYENSKFGEDPYSGPEGPYKRPDDFPYPGDFEGYKKPIEFTIPSDYKERKKISEFAYPEKSSYKHYKKPSEFSETSYVNEHKSNKEPEFSYFDEHKLNKQYKHEFNSYKEPSGFPYYSKSIKNHFSSNKDQFDFPYSKKHHFEHFKEAEKPPPVEFQFSHFDKKPHSLESFKEPYTSSHLGGYKFLEKPEKNEDIQEEPDFYKSYKHDYSSFKKPSSISYFSGPKFVEKPTKPTIQFNLFEEPKKFSYSGSSSSGSSNKYTPKPFREPSALTMIKQTKFAPTHTLSGSYDKHKSLLDEYYKYQYKKNRYNPQIIKQAFATATPPPSTTPTHVHHNSHYDIQKSRRYPGNNDVHSMLSKYANSYFNQQKYNNRYKDYQENAQKYQNIQQSAPEANEIPVNEPQPEETLPEQPKKEDKKPLMPTIRVEDLNIQDGEVDNRDLEMMVKIVNNILQVLPYNP